ncbi:hypothetical protein [Natronobiforma cellulositropha]|uniref:hypothetical protein n=1 Tax=Natronobiforma cellulositropha TaxID=1679076 RepID=UPI0021D60711|nr:hypothetical protein [Natronobiforma cellulositropha]
MTYTRRNVLETGASALLLGSSAGAVIGATGGSVAAASNSLELLAEEYVDHHHACFHAENDDRTGLMAGGSCGSGQTVDQTHVIWDVSYGGSEGYVTFDADSHPYSGPFVFYVANGSATVCEGTYLDGGSVGDCAELDEYLEVDPDNGSITLELSAL